MYRPQWVPRAARISYYAPIIKPLSASKASSAVQFDAIIYSDCAVYPDKNYNYQLKRSVFMYRCPCLVTVSVVLHAYVDIILFRLRFRYDFCCI